jgi:hypothetical protein
MYSGAMKKILLICGIILVIFIGLTYWSASSTPKKYDTCQILGLGDIDKIDFKEHDSVLVAASTLYEGGDLKKVMQGEHYREVWVQPVTVPIVFLDTLFGGMEILEEGGGKQTHSLKLKTKKGSIYTLRSISKDPEPLVPEIARVLGLENIVIDGVSAQHPYAAVVVAELSKSAEILSTMPKVVFVPKQPRLSSFNGKYGNRLYLLEHETKGKGYWTGLKGVSEIIDTEDLQQFKMEKPDKVSIDESALVRARLFDLIIGDWDRHAKQWGWAIQKEGGVSTAIPLPCDRDNAFFNLEGILPTLIANENFHPRVQSFDDEIEYLDGLVGPFDVYFLKKVPEEIFLEEAKVLQRLITEEEISRAFQVWPKNIFALDGEEIISKIMQRTNNLPKYAKQFKKILEERDWVTVALKGSEDLELNKEQMACFECYQ